MKGRKVLLINPWIYDFAAYDMWAKPLGLLWLGALLRRNGCEVSYIDCLRSPHPLMNVKEPKVFPGGHGKFYRQIIETPPQLKGIKRRYSRYGISIDAFEHDLSRAGRADAVLVTSLMTYWYPGVFQAISSIRKVFGDVPVILGGVYATLCEEHAHKFSGADHIITGEGELNLLRLLSTLWGEPPSFVPDMKDLDSSPYPCFDLIEEPRYVCIQTSRGCPFRCTYCASHILCPTMRRRDPIRVVEEISFWEKTNWIKDFAFYDDALLFEPNKFALPMMKEVISQGLDVRFHCPNGLHIRPITREVAASMKASGFKTIRFGLETADPVRQKKTGGKVTNDDFLRTMENMKDAGFNAEDIGVYILCGLPGQTAEEVLDAVELVKRTGVRAMITEYSPIPHTQDWEAAVQSSAYPIADEPLFHNNTFLSCRWDGLTYEMYQEIKRAAREKDRD
jgi:radical SAM superfamily enzyme YgiQ (UPF0313 family)